MKKSESPTGFEPMTSPKHRAGPLSTSLRAADAFPVVTSLPPKNSVCEPKRQNDFRDVKPF